MVFNALHALLHCTALSERVSPTDTALCVLESESDVLQVRILEKCWIFQAKSERAIKSDVGEPDQGVRNPPRPAKVKRSPSNSSGSVSV